MAVRWFYSKEGTCPGTPAPFLNLTTANPDKIMLKKRLTSLSLGHKTSQRKPRRTRKPTLESLEPRLALATVLWDGEAGDNDWNNAANWFDDTNGLNDVLPGAGDDAVIGAPFAGQTIAHSSGNTSINRVTSDAHLSISGGTFSVTAVKSTETADPGSQVNGDFTYSGGTLTGAGTLTINGHTTWSGGTMFGSGVTDASGGLTISGSRALANTRQLINRGAANYNGDGSRLTLNAGTSLVNESTGVFTLDDTSGITGAGRFDNLGTFIKQGGESLIGNFGGTGTPTFNNIGPAGLVDVQDGTLRIGNNGTHTGAFSIAAGGQMQLIASTNTFDSGASLSGPSITFVGGTTNFQSRQQLGRRHAHAERRDRESR